MTCTRPHSCTPSLTHSHTHRGVLPLCADALESPSSLHLERTFLHPRRCCPPPPTALSPAALREPPGCRTDGLGGAGSEPLGPLAPLGTRSLRLLPPGLLQSLGLLGEEHTSSADGLPPSGPVLSPAEKLFQTHSSAPLSRSSALLAPPRVRKDLLRESIAPRFKMMIFLLL